MFGLTKFVPQVISLSFLFTYNFPALFERFWCVCTHSWGFLWCYSFVEFLQNVRKARVHSCLVLRDSTAVNCNGTVRTYSGIIARARGFTTEQSEVHLCKNHSIEYARKEVCCFPISGPCSKIIKHCPHRFFPFFQELNPKQISTKICSIHLKETDKHPAITRHHLYEIYFKTL